MTEETQKNSPKVVYKAVLQLTDFLANAQEQFFRPLSSDALTSAEYGEIALSAAVNHVRHVLYTLVSEQSREAVIDAMALALKIPSTVMTEEDIKAENDAKLAREQAFREKQEELRYVIETKKAILDNIHKTEGKII